VRESLAAVLLLFPLLLQAAEPGVKGGGETPDEALQRLQRAAERRDLIGMTATLERENRALLLRDFYLVALGLHAGEEGEVKAHPEQAAALNELLEKKIGPALMKNPIDEEKVASLNEEQLAVVLIGWGISHLPFDDVIHVARVIETALSKAPHEATKQLFDAYVEQVPKGALTVNRRTDDAVWAMADGRPLGFTKVDGRWFAGGVWYTKQTFSLDSSTPKTND
jgi:hypothetical protein